MHPWKRFLRETRGQDTIEWALLAAFISIVAITALYNLSPLVRQAFSGVRFALMSMRSGAVGWF
jgi:Flp pilus assembly pilin Flp